MSVVVDTSGLYALLDENDGSHASARAYWLPSSDEDFVAHTYVIVETLALVRRRLGWGGIDALAELILPRLRVVAVDRNLHDRGLAAYRSARGGQSYVDHVTILFARDNEIESAFAFDRDLEAAGLRLPA